jgi:cytoskeleton protein RodZ
VFEIGNSLREARLRQGLDFPEVEQATKIRGKYLRSLEEEQFDVLPGQTYVKGFLRSYADYLGLDGQLYVEEFNSRYVRGELEEETEQQPFRPRSVRAAGRSGGLQGKAVMLTVAVIAGLTVFVFAAWMWGGDENTPDLFRSPPAGPAARKPTAKLVTSAVAGGAYVAVYKGVREKKRQIYAGTLEKGHPRTFEGRRLWLYVFAPANLRLRLNGKPQVVPGAGTGARRWLEVTPKRVSLAPPLG